jgi:hypothetical protein
MSYEVVILLEDGTAQTIFKNYPYCLCFDVFLLQATSRKALHQQVGVLSMLFDVSSVFIYGAA